MKPNLRVGLLVSNDHPEVEDSAALAAVVEAIADVGDEAPGEVLIAIFTPEHSMWIFTAHHGVYELQRGADGRWRAVAIEC